MIERQNRRKFSHCQPFVLYRHLIEFCRYWRQLESHDFYGFDKNATDEMYWYFNYKLRSLFAGQLDLYWLIQGFDGGLLYQDGSELDSFWIRPLTSSDL